MPALDLALRHFPARFAELGFSVALPRDWTGHELPLEETDFSNPTQFAPMGVVTAPHSAIVFTFAARPAFADGTLHDWANYLLAQQGMQLRSIGPYRVGLHAALVGEAVQASDVGPLVVRLALFEDGGRLVQIMLSAPEMLAGAMAEAWFATLYSFVLAQPRGARVALYPSAPEAGADAAGLVDADNARPAGGGTVRGAHLRRRSIARGPAGADAPAARRTAAPAAARELACEPVAD